MLTPVTNVQCPASPSQDGVVQFADSRAASRCIPVPRNPEAERDDCDWNSGKFNPSGQHSTIALSNTVVAFQTQPSLGHVRLWLIRFVEDLTPVDWSGYCFLLDDYNRLWQ